MDIYVAVDKEIPGLENITLSGEYLSKVYEGPYKDTAKWHEDFSKVVAERGLKVTKYYLWYTSCPECAKKYGKNYVVILGKIG